MSFTPECTVLLEDKLDRKHVKTRVVGKQTVSYLQGWHVVAEANRIFGFAGWHRETVDLRVASEGPYIIGKDTNWPKEGWSVAYLAKVKISVATVDGGKVVREGIGVGHGIDQDLGKAHESAAKEAETDATKRAMSTFGNQFGLALYEPSQSNVEDKDAIEREAALEKEREVREFTAKHDLINALVECKTMNDLVEFMKAKKAEIRALPEGFQDEVKNAATVHKAALQSLEQVGM